MKISYLLPYALVKLTGHGRYLPKIQWATNSWVHNIFRVYELIFWRKIGIRAEAATRYDGKTVMVELYTFEAVCAHFETLLRNFFSIKWLDIKVVQWEFALPVNTPQVRIPWISFAIAIDVANASGDQTTSPFTFSHTTTGSNPFMHVGTRNWSNGGQPVVTAVSYNSVAASKATGITRTGQNFNEATIWFLGNPATGANNVSVTATLQQFGHGIAGCVTYSGAQSTNTADATGTNNTATSGAYTATVTTVAENCWVAAASFNDTDGSNQATMTSPTHTSRWNTQVPNEVGAGQDTNGAVAAGTGVNIGWTKNLSSASGICAASFAPAAGGGAVAAIGGPAMPIPVNQNVNELQIV